MVNITIAPGGGVIANGVVTYLPKCSTLKFEDVNLQNAAAFDITDSSYLERLIPSVVPGLFFGILSLVPFIFWFLWLCMQCGQRWRFKRRAAAEQAQFLTSREQQIENASYWPADAPIHPMHERRDHAAFVYKAILLTFALALVGISSWGMVESIALTSNTISEFWKIVNVVNEKVANAESELDLLGQQLLDLSSNVSVVSSKAPEILTVFDTVVGWLNSSDLAAVVAASSKKFNASTAIGSALNSTTRFLNSSTNVTAVRNRAETAVEALVGLPTIIDNIHLSIDSGVALLGDTFRKIIKDIRHSWERPTMAIENTWRFIPIAVVFGTTILFSVVIAVTFWSLRWYRASTVALLFFWLDISLLMFLGVGLLRSVYVVSSDACLYAEYSSMVLADRKVAATRRERVLSIFSYYYGLRAIPDAMVMDSLIGVPTYLLHEFVSGPILPVASKVLEMGSLPQVQALLIQAGLQGDACPGCIEALDHVTGLLPNVSNTVWALEEQALTASIAPLYHQIKEYLCCTLSYSSSAIWLAWTCAGTIGFVLGVMCTARMAHHTLNLRRYERQLAAAAAAAAEGLCSAAATTASPRSNEGLEIAAPAATGPMGKQRQAQ